MNHYKYIMRVYHSWARSTVGFLLATIANIHNIHIFVKHFPILVMVCNYVHGFLCILFYHQNCI